MGTDDDLENTSPKTIREIAAQIRETLAVCWEFARPYRGTLAFAYAATLGIEILAVILPWLASRLTAQVAGHELGFRWGDALPILLGVQAVWLAWMGIDVIRDLLSDRIIRSLGRDLPLAALARLISLPRRFHQEHNATELTAKVTRGAAYVTDTVDLMLFNILPLATMVVGTLVLFAWLNTGLFLISLGILAAYVLLTLKGRLRMQVHNDLRNSLQRRADALSGEGVASALIVQAFHNEGWLLRTVGELRQAMLDHQRLEARIGTRNWMLRGVLSDQCQWAMMVLSLYLLRAGRLSFSTFVFVISMVQRYRDQLFNFGWMYDRLAEKANAIRRLKSVLSERSSIVDPADPEPLPEQDCATVRFEGVGFLYPSETETGGERWALRGITLDIPAGSVLGIAGESGHGKSTFINLMLRFEDPTEGTVSANGTDLRRVRLGDLRRRIGYIEQSVRLFNDTVRANIAFGGTFTDEQVVEAAKIAGAHEFITGLPKGYDTVIGDRGTKLSGGQQQRLAIARAVVRKPSLLILDEATSSIDPKSIEAIMRALEALKGRCTIVIVSHQLSTLQRLADRIAVIRHGRIAELGTHEELMRQNGLYQELVGIQQAQERFDF